jgi:hypothetical protein
MTGQGAIAKSSTFEATPREMVSEEVVPCGSVEDVRSRTQEDRDIFRACYEAIDCAE